MADEGLFFCSIFQKHQQRVGAFCNATRSAQLRAQDFAGNRCFESRFTTIPDHYTIFQNKPHQVVPVCECFLWSAVGFRVPGRWVTLFDSTVNLPSSSGKSFNFGVVGSSHGASPNWMNCLFLLCNLVNMFRSGPLSNPRCLAAAGSPKQHNCQC